MEDKNKKFILWFDQVGIADVASVGGKNASLGEMYTTLVPKGIRVPNGFVITAYAYRYFIEKEGLTSFIKETLKDLDTEDIKNLQKKGKAIREKIIAANAPDEIEKEIAEAYKNLSSAYNMDEADTAVRSSATAEDLPGASFAGEHETYLNVVGEEKVLYAIRDAMGSLFTARAISYRVDKGFDHFAIALSVGVQKMVRSDKGVSGVMFTLDTESGFRNVVEINASWGLGEMVVQGKVTPDEYLVFKPTFNQGFRPIIRKILGSKTVKMIYSTHSKRPVHHASGGVREVKVSPKERNRFVLTDDEILTLSRWGMQIEEHYSGRAGHPMPMDMEWAKDGESGELYIVQARPETVQAEKKNLTRTDYTLHTNETPMVEGISVGTKIVSGKARIITKTAKLYKFQPGEILITEITDPDWEPIMKIATAIVTEKGGRTSLAAIVSRELGIPAVIGTGNATKKIKTGELITVDTSSGSVGRVYEGKLEWEESTYKVTDIPEVKTKLCLNVGSPESAFVHSFLPNKGVGLAREEFIIASHIRIHPLALINFSSLKSRSLKKKINELTVGYDDKVTFFVGKLAQGIGEIGAAFWPNDVIVRFSDFKTNEYAAHYHI